MTGYGKGVVLINDKKLNIEVKSLNAKTAEISVKSPYFLREKELEIRKMVSGELERGKIEVFISFEKSQDSPLSCSINKEVVEAYIEQLSQFSPKYADEREFLKIALRLPFSTTQDSNEEISLTKEQEVEFFKSLASALKDLKQYRQNEGKALEADFYLRINNIRKLLECVEVEDAQRIPSVRERLLLACSEIKDKVDENRFEQEMIFYIEKLDITEEKVRLRNHLDYFEKTMQEREHSGKKLAFIAQEMGREINTIGSKANDATVQQRVVEMKDELEKIKEQVLNIL